MHNKLNSSQISVVVQGVIDKKITPKCLKSIRKYLSKAEIILSTWEDSDISGLDYDKIIFNKDCGAYCFGYPLDKPNNINRMLLSSKAGIALCTREYILKLRSDLVLYNNKILKLTDKYKRTDDYKVFDKRIFANDIYSIKYEKSNENIHYRPFHISDWWYFGKREDITKLFDVALAPEPQTSHYFLCHEMPENKYHRFRHLTWRYSPEQYLHLNCVRKLYPNVNLEHILDYNEENIKQSEIYTVNNFIILPPEQSGIYSEKDIYKNYAAVRRKTTIADSIYTKYRWLCDYQKYIDNDYKFAPVFLYREKAVSSKQYNQFSKHLKRLQQVAGETFTNMFRTMSESVSTVFYGIVFLTLLFKLLKHMRDK